MSVRLLPSAAALGVLFSIAGAARVGSLVQRAPEAAVALENPMAGQADANRAGAKLFVRECAACHGSHGEGIGKAPPLSQPEVVDAPPGTLFWILKNGSLHTGMPSFAHLPEPQRWQIVSYLKSLRRR